jgi:putative proteasome-type protease
MTFCLGMRVQEGLVGIADTRVTSGNEVIQARKVSVFHQDGGGMFLMTSGLRSVRDKALTYFDDILAERQEPFDRLFKAVSAFAA